MRVTQSNAEFDLIQVLQDNAIRYMSQETICVKATVVDVYLPESRTLVYLDGPHHKKGKSVIWDAEIDAILSRRGFRILRYIYKPPIKKWQLAEILADIRKTDRKSVFKDWT